MKKTALTLITLIITLVLTGCGEAKVKFAPDSSEPSLDAPNAEVNIEETKELEPVDLEVTTPEGRKLKTNEGYHVIRGTTPRDTHKVVVNDYELTRYMPGQTEWSYIASENLGTLEEGKNEFEVIAYDAEGEEIDDTKTRIDYEKPVAPELPDTGMGAWVAMLIGLLGTTAYRFKKLLQAA